MTLSQIHVLVAVADTGSLSGAAVRLGMSQSGVSQSIAALETTLGVQLMTRTRRGAVATAVGEQVLAHARQTLLSLAEVRRIAETASGVAQGRLRLAAFSSVFSTLLPPLLRKFRELHPGIDVVALEATDAEIDTWLADGTVDLGVTSHARLQDCAFPLGQDDWVAVVPAGHAIATSRVREISLSQLANEPFVLATGGCTHHARSLAEDLGFELTDIRVEVRDWASSYALVREGLGVTVVPEPTLPDDLRGLRVLPLTDNLHRYFGLKSSEQTSGTPLVVTFLEVASSLARFNED